MKSDIMDIIQSWGETERTVNSTESLLQWIGEMNKKIKVNVQETEMRPGDFWLFNEETGYIENTAQKFFSIRGIQFYKRGKFIAEQPIIYQPEIGFLGIICKKINNVMHFLMQAKIEPGNVNCVQISPTIQATRSNFERVHGGYCPAYLDYFENSDKYTVIFDQIQSEQGTRFYKKRNRNIMVRVDEDIEEKESFRWMTLGQIKQLMKIDNLVNMDTRTVLSCIPFSTYRYSEAELNMMEKYFEKNELFQSIFFANIQDGIVSAYNYLNNVKMFLDAQSKIVPLTELNNWNIGSRGMICTEESNFDVKYFDIKISGREVEAWSQPLLCARGIGTFGLFVCKHNGMLKFLVSVKEEIGAFDTIEIGPTVFAEAVNNEKGNFVTDLFFEQLKNRQGVINDCLFSEEGGRFYHEQNRNVIIMTDYIEPALLPKGFFWMSYSSLNDLVQINNCLNIQLRNLLSILEV